MQSSEFKKLGEVEFPMGTELTNLAKSQLDALKTELLKRPKAAIYIYGHASTDGDFEKNQQIAYTRAANVRKYLTSKGIDASKMEIVPLGEYKTLSGTDKSNMKDRRAEIFIRE
jgi:outer membrane protein OmpA-like peptidoglycan-associated protein